MLVSKSNFVRMVELKKRSHWLRFCLFNRELSLVFLSSIRSEYVPEVR
ncbi:hypothetical protein VCR1J2_200350 [Vibrio coralliirubri]|nr:hypothetical protein VCR1J2_200350 [Vibrio coralliirubri]CDT75877.1 hypothetical protein VCR8J2_190392 [Vibrio coralliirubri]